MNNQPDMHEERKYRRCIPCAANRHNECWGSRKIDPHVTALYWCECSCVLEQERG